MSPNRPRTVAEKRELAKRLLREKRLAAPPTESSRRDLPGYTTQTYDMFLQSSSREHAESARFFEWVQAVQDDDAYSFEAARLSPQLPEIDVQRTNGTTRRCLNMSSYNYLGYSTHPRVIEAAKDALDRFGLGCASSPVISGTFAIHKRFEQELVEFFGLPGRAVSLFSSGYGVNTGVISSFVKKGHHVVLDRSAHMSIQEGAQLSNATISYFQHNDAAHLEQVLRRVCMDNSRVLVCVEGVYSADGDHGRLHEIVQVAKRYEAAVLVDEAHSVLIAGEHGRGVCEEAGVLQDVDLYVMTFSKAFGGVGGALLAREDIVRYVNWYARCRMFSCGLDPAVTGGLLQVLDLARGSDGKERRLRIRENARVLRAQLHGSVDIGSSDSWIVPVLYGHEQWTLPLNNWLQVEGLDTSIMQFPAVPKNESRIRLFVTSEHSTDQLSRAAEIISRAAQEFGFSRGGSPNGAHS